MKAFKSKSMTPGVSDFEIENGCHSISFLSFERAIRETDELAGIKKPILGYRVTEHGIEIIRN